MDRPLPRMLRAMGWAILETPFYFLVLNGNRFLQNTGPLRRRTERRIAADMLAVSGLGGLAIRGVQVLRGRRRFDRRYETQPIAEYGGWADRIWPTARSSMRWERCAAQIICGTSILAPDPAPVLRNTTHGRRRTGGWVQMLDCQPRDRSYFGAMRVAALVDGVGPPRAVPSLIACGVKAARERKADLVISNQMHRDWTVALKAAGFWRGPSNYLLALSKPLRKLLEPLDKAIPHIHFNRGDGDGRVNLIESGATARSQPGI